MKTTIFPDATRLEPPNLPLRGPQTRCPDRSVVRSTAAWVLLLSIGLTLPARACLNDTSINQSEKEFKSEYERPAPPVQQRAEFSPWALAALSIGGGLAAGSLMVAVGRQRRGSK